MASGGAEYEYYRRIKLLGEGAFGKAFLVECVSDGAKCVIKQMDLNNMTEEERRETFKEARILEALKHPNIIRFREVYQTKQGKLCIVMDFADGGDLSKKIQDNKKIGFTENQILDWFTQICLAMKHVHDRKILHRDLKSQNIFLTKDNTIKLGDFGIARILSHTHEKAKTMVGTPYYLSPEIIENMPYSFKSDIWSMGVILYELCCLEPPFNADSLSCLALRIVRGNYAPISSNYSKELKNLVSSMLQSDPNKRPNVHQILKLPVITNRIKNFLSESIKSNEFSHTIFHRKKCVDLKDMAPELKGEQPPHQRNGPQGYAHYPLNPYNIIQKNNNPNAMDYMPVKKEQPQNNVYNHNNNPFISPKNEFLYKDIPLQQPQANNFKNDFAEKRKHAISPSPRYRENNVAEKLNEKVLNKREQKASPANYKPSNLDFSKPKDNFNLLPPTSNRNKEGLVLKTPFKELKKEEKNNYNFQKPLINNSSSQENIGKNEVCITEPSKIARKNSEQKFEALKKKFNIKDKEEEMKEIRKQELQKEKNRELERKQMMNDIEKKRSINKKKSDDLVIEWVGPILPKKENNVEKGVSASEGKENHSRGEKKPEFTNFEDVISDVEEEKVNIPIIPINDNKIIKNSSPIEKNEKVSEGHILKEKKEKDIFDSQKFELNDKLDITDLDTDMSQILIELQDIVSGKEPLVDPDFETKMKTIKEDDREEREDDLNELRESENEQKQIIYLSKKKTNNFIEDKENIFKNGNMNYKISLQGFLEENLGKEETNKVLVYIREKLKTQDLLELYNDFYLDHFSKSFPFIKKEELEKNISLLINLVLIDKENEV